MKRLEKAGAGFNFEEKNNTPVTQNIELTNNDETPKDGYEIGTGFGHFAFGVKSMDEFTKRLKELKYEYLYEPFDLTGKGSKIAFVKDPDGYEIELIEKVNW